MNVELSGDRRTFLKRAALFGWLGVVLVSVRPDSPGPKKELPAPSPAHQGYRLTEHVKRYYETAR